MDGQPTMKIAPLAFGPVELKTLEIFFFQPTDLQIKFCSKHINHISIQQGKVQNTYMNMQASVILPGFPEKTHQEEDQWLQKMSAVDLSVQPMIPVYAALLISHALHLVVSELIKD